MKKHIGHTSNFNSSGKGKLLIILMSLALRMPPNSETTAFYPGTTSCVLLCPRFMFLTSESRILMWKTINKRFSLSGVYRVGDGGGEQLHTQPRRVNRHTGSCPSIMLFQAASLPHTHSRSSGFEGRSHHVPLHEHQGLQA